MFDVEGDMEWLGDIERLGYELGEGVVKVSGEAEWVAEGVVFVVMLAVREAFGVTEDVGVGLGEGKELELEDGTSLGAHMYRFVIPCPPDPYQTKDCPPDPCPSQPDQVEANSAGL